MSKLRFHQIKSSHTGLRMENTETSVGEEDYYFRLFFNTITIPASQHLLAWIINNLMQLKTLMGLLCEYENGLGNEFALRSYTFKI